MAKITAHFDSTEFRQKNGNVAYPEQWVEPRLRKLCAALEVLRAELGKPITIISGYRSEIYNKKIGGARASQHCLGRAADIVVAGATPKQVHEATLHLYNEAMIAIGGLGYYPPKNGKGGFVHIDVRPGERLARWTGSRTSS
jgi:uncharacterized protein YcbK (DUF882 family)